MSEEWGPWIEHDGRLVPVQSGTFIHIVFEDNDEWVGRENVDVSRSKFGVLIIPDGDAPYGWIWSHPECKRGDKIIRYRVRKPRGLTILEHIAQQPERADA